MRARLAFGISLAIDFDCYLIDEIISVGDKRFQKKSFDELFGRRKGNAMIIVSHNFEVIQDFCSAVLVLKDGRGRVFQDKRKAFDIYATL
jgi:capsular polysaccharide transport system ATP-binding protein